MNQLTITQAFESNYRIKGSKFLSFVFPCIELENIEWRLKTIKELHPTATHHCYAYRIGPVECIEFSQNDGEPAGTAGGPILNEMKSAHLVNCICIVVRYYGGTKLGKSGLIDAYSTAAGLAIQKSKLKKIVPTVSYSITYAYDQQTIIEKLKHTFTLYETESKYTEEVELTLACPLFQQNKFEKRLDAISHLLISVKKGSRSFQIVS